MLTYLTTNLFESPARTLVNTVNTVGVMGKGIANDFKRLYPSMYQQYRDICLKGELDIGKLHVYRTQNKTIINFPTKKHWRQRSRLEHVEAGLKTFISNYTDYGISSVSFPQLGCGNGELDWETQVQPMMEGYLKILPIPVYIHLYPKALDFVPERLDLEYARHVIEEEREQKSSSEVWHDIRSIVSMCISQTDLFDHPAETDEERFILGNDEYIDLIIKDDTIFRLDREIFNDLWDLLRLRGTLKLDDVPAENNKELIATKLFDLLSKLAYIKDIELRPVDYPDTTRGLMYLPMSAI